MNRGFIVTTEQRRFTEFANAVRQYANWDALEPDLTAWTPRGDHDAKHYALANRSRPVFFTPEVLCRPKTLMDEVDHWQTRVGICADEHLRTLDPVPLKPGRAAHLVELLILDEAERLTPVALELLRDRHDRTHLAMILIGMPGIDQRFRHYPQLYSRLGFSHHYRAAASIFVIGK